MDDLISRQAAISAICNACGKIDCDKMDKCEKLQLPPANSSEFPNNSDTISRQAAIDAFNTNLNELVVGGEENAKTVENYLNRVLDKIKCLPSAEPEIIRCKDCKHYWIHKCMDSMPIERCDLEQTFYDPERDFCSLAEKREVTT